MSEPQNADPLILAAAVRASVIPLSRVLRRTDSDLTPTQLSVLSVVSRFGPISMGDIAERERLSRPMITRCVDALVEAGLVERTTDDNDRRVCRARLSPTGERWIADRRLLRDQWLAARLSRLDDEQRETIAAAAQLLDSLVGEHDRG